MNEAHTPGPWRIVERAVMEDGSIYPKHVVGGGHDFQVCLLETTVVAELITNGPAWAKSVSSSAISANARLISEAPELLSVLRNCERVLSDLPSTSKEGTTTRATWRTVRAAIAKATGAA